jgi:hypothetical protein
MSTRDLRHADHTDSDREADTEVAAEHRNESINGFKTRENRPEMAYFQEV